MVEMGNGVGIRTGDREFERAYLATLIIDGQDTNLFGITPDNFRFIENRKIFEAILQVIEDGVERVDLLSLSKRLESNGDLDYIGGNLALVELTDGNFSVSNRQYYADKIKEETKRIEVVKIAERLKMVAASSGKLDGTVYQMAKELITLDTLSEGKYDLSKDIEQTMSTLEENRGKEMYGPALGNDFLDKYLKGIRPGKVYRIGGESNLGKSQFAYGIIPKLLDQGKKVAFFTLENSKDVTITNLVANYQGVNSHKIENLTVEPDFGWLDSKKDLLTIVEDCWDLGDIFSRCLQLRPDIVILDFIGLVNIKGFQDDDHYTAYAKQVQQFAKEEQIGWIDLSNLEMRADENTIKVLGNFYGSSFLRNTADVGIHLWRNQGFEKYRTAVYSMQGVPQEKKDKLKNIQVIDMYISKNRMGTARILETFKIDFDQGGRFVLPTEEEKTAWKMAAEGF